MRVHDAVFVLVLSLAPIGFGAPPSGVKLEQNIPYVANGDPAEVLDLYVPEKPADKPQPLVVWIHGGGWHGGSKSGCYAAYLSREGYVVASVEYRFSNKALFPAQIQDCQAAIRWLRANSKTYNIDPDHIGAAGDSAGGHLVALLDTSGGKNAFPAIGNNADQSDRVQAVCDFYGPTDFSTVMAQAADDPTVKSIIKFNKPGDPYSGVIGLKLGEDPAKEQAVSPMHYVSGDDPPILIMHGNRDPIVPYAQSEEFLAALQKVGVDATLQTIPGAGHGGPMFYTSMVKKLMKTFFDKHLKQLDVKVETLPADAFAPATPALAPTK
jgi:acetyl esterase/lipase